MRNIREHQGTTGNPSSLGGQSQMGLRRLPCPVAQVLPPFAAVGAPPVKDPQGPHLLGDGTPNTLFQMGADLQKNMHRKRFRCLYLTGGSQYYSSKKVCQIIVACCMLHNLALRRLVPFLQEDEPGDGRVAAVEPMDSDQDEARKKMWTTEVH
ncbi:hypothetical protein NDU88_009825 [Pleurodeles waltl]|uniref:Nuclease HARBI1 n=1 Tax=Pleurodeles waltl TaxID=8319 RepID=A0AAV7QSP1_PLEWA|nr:hypothetical protein NDU88_009825 [Pleurodeles waltl]